MGDEQDTKPPVEDTPVEEVDEKASKAGETADEVVETPPETAPVTDDAPKDDGIPSWGKDLMSQVNDLAAKVAAPAQEGVHVVEDQPDETPVRPPWHKRGLFG